MGAVKDGSTGGEAIEATWARIERWLGQRAPEVLASLLPGVGEEGLGRIEREIGASLPEDLRASLKRHAGSTRALSGEWELHPPAMILGTWTMMRGFAEDGVFPHGELTPGSVVGPLVPTWWTRGWIPVAGNGAGDHLCVDLSPAEGGTRGQVLRYLHDHEHREVIATGFGAWLGALANGLEQGTIVAIEDPQGHLEGLYPPERLENLREEGVDTEGWAIRPRQEEEVAPAVSAVDEEGARLIDLLLQKELLVLAEPADREALAAGLGKLLARRGSAEKKAAAVCAWMEKQAGIEEIFVTDEELAALLDAW
ncbi:SMI1/KNR4 family protein [Chondromyces apiculatus]|nr:SMI1/KNR4 family protein [Chondromyces apiculatus]